MSPNVTKSICAPTTPFTRVNTNKKIGLPCGVEEAVPRDAVSRCYWGNEPESRSAAPINLPLKPIIAVFRWNKYRNKLTELLLRFAIIYIRYQIQLFSSKRTIRSKCSPTEDSGGVLGLRKLFTAQQLREFEIWCFMYQTSEAEKVVCVFTQIRITPWQSQRDLVCSFHCDQGNGLRHQSWEV